MSTPTTTTIQDCVNPPKYLDTSEFATFGFHVLTIIEIPIQGFAFYVIIAKTPVKMRSVKWAMFNLHFWSAFLDVSFSFLTVPYLFFPLIAGNSFGVFTYFEVDPALQCCFLAAMFGMTVVSTIVLFENRYTIIRNSGKCSRRVRRCLIAFAYLFALFFSLPFAYIVPEQTGAIRLVLKRLPTLRCSYTGPIFVFTTDATLLGIVAALKLLVEFLSIITLVSLTSYHIFIQTKRSSMSRSTVSLQKRFLLALLIQTSIPVVIMMFPVLYCANAMVLGYYNQAANNICLIIMASHGLISTIAMLMIHEPYRYATLPCLSGAKRKLTRAASVSVAFAPKYPINAF